MATGPTPLFRFVRCPKCCRVLPEVPDVPVYRCGGCGALLQAKTGKKDVKRKEQNFVSEDKESSRLNHEAKPSSSNCSVDYSNDIDQNGYEGCKIEEHEAVDLSSNETHKNGDFCGSEDCDMEGPGIESEVYSSTELVHNDPKKPLPSTELVHNEYGSVLGNGNLLSTHSASVSSPRGQSRGTVTQCFGSMRSGVTEYASPSSEFSCIIRDGSKSPTARGSHAYDASISSYDDQFPDTSLKTRRDQFLVDDELEEPARTRHPPRNLTRVERKDFHPKVFSSRRSFQAAGYGSGSFSSQVHEDCKWDPGSRLEYQRQEKMKLLRVIRELQDQLDNSCNMEGNEKNMEETWHCARSRQGSNPSQQSQFARMSFSGEAPNSRNHHIGRQCLHCHPQNWKHSAPLRSYIEPDEFSSWSREMKCGDQRHKDHVMRKYTRERPIVAKKHFRPKAGGAPFITCYRCSKLLQLPEDFLLFKRRYYKLRCGACATILKFSVQNRTHIIPYSPNEVDLDPPPSEVDEYRTSTASSYLDHSRLSCKSYSMEGAPQDNSSHDRKMSYAASFFSMEKIRNKYKGRVEEAYGSARPSTSMSKAEKFPSETQAQRHQRSNSPLHRLMGYSSPSLVIRGTGMSPASTSHVW